MAVPFLRETTLPCTEQQLEALTHCLSRPEAFGPVNSWGPEVFTEIGTFAGVEQKILVVNFSLELESVTLNSDVGGRRNSQLGDCVSVQWAWRIWCCQLWFQNNWRDSHLKPSLWWHQERWQWVQLLLMFSTLFRLFEIRFKSNSHVTVRMIWSLKSDFTLSLCHSHRGVTSPRLNKVYFLASEVTPQCGLMVGDSNLDFQAELITFT